MTLTVLWSGAGKDAPDPVNLLDTVPLPNDLTLKVDDEDRALTVQPDVVDLRDRYYSPSLIPLKQSVLPQLAALRIRDQRDDPSCTGFALASVIDQQCRHMFGEASAIQVSARMLFEMARLHDDLPDEDLAGSTLRGALKGFFHNGVCRLSDQNPDVRPPLSPPWSLTVPLAQEARNISLGAYFRLNHEINDYHSAINEAGALVASAKIHDGWRAPTEGAIQRRSRFQGRHAFAIVGYNSDGFLVQNSWGAGWGGFEGLPGVALWSYEDWFENVEDAWVLRLAVSSPRAFDVKFARNHARSRKPGATTASPKPRRQDILGHYLHIDDGALVTRGRYAQTLDSIRTTAGLLEKGGYDPRSDPYKHLLIFTHGALSDRFAVAARIKAWHRVFKGTGIYPLHIMWETGFNNDVVDVVKDLLFKTRKRMGTHAAHTDERLEALARPLGRKLWRDLKTTSALAFGKDARGDQTDGGKALRCFMRAAVSRPNPMKIHFASVSGGALLLEGMIKAAEELGQKITTASLLAPACSIAHYDRAIRPHVGSTIKSLRQYSLISRREHDDSVDVYGKSLLELVSNALEATPGAPLLGLEEDLAALGTPLPKAHKVFFAGRDPAHTNSKSHRDFDSDLKTMNDVLATVLGTKPGAALRFSKAHLSGY